MCMVNAATTAPCPLHAAPGDSCGSRLAPARAQRLLTVCRPSAALRRAGKARTTHTRITVVASLRRSRSVSRKIPASEGAPRIVMSFRIRNVTEACLASLCQRGGDNLYGQMC